jgi:DNA primase
MPLDIESILAQIGVVVTRQDGEEYWALCPQHRQRTGKDDSHPSWSMNAGTFAHHCFSCGYSGNLTSLYRDLMGDVPDDLEWEVAKTSMQSTLERIDREEVVSGPNISEWALKQYHDVPARLLELRKLARASIDLYGIRWNREDRCWVIPIRTVEGDLLGFQFRQKGLVLNHPKGMEKASTLFGLHHLLEHPRIAVVESPLDAVRLHGVGAPAVATFGASVSDEQVDLLARHYRFIVVAMDNDPPGIRSSFYLRSALKKRGCVAVDFDYTGLAAKDPGDVESDEALLKAWNRSNSLNLIP